jgi:hypothetical protein
MDRGLILTSMREARPWMGLTRTGGGCRIRWRR